jgi:glycosyltransferase involved in cell wall biosynthesis
VVTDSLTRTSADNDVAIVHDYLTQRGGAERVVLALSRTFPSAPIYTSVYQKESTFPEFADRQIETTALQHLPMVRRHHRIGLPLYPTAFSHLHVHAKVVICSTSGWAHGVATDGTKVLYVHNPARWLYQTGDYLRGAPRWQKMSLSAGASWLKSWDRREARSAHLVLANSMVVQDRIRRSWGIESTVVHPPHGADVNAIREPVPGLEHGFLLCVARLLPYKHVDAIIGAMEILTDDRLVVAGDGPLRRHLEAAAPSNVSFLTGVSDAILRWLYANARFFVAAATDDFGLAPVEAMAFGTPSVLIRNAGYIETGIEGETGIFFDRPDPRDIAAAVRCADHQYWSRARLHRHAQRHSETSFSEEVRALVRTVTSSVVDENDRAS